jgi:colanic acid biosynthesis glycosyl transferase WcaI
LELVKRGHEVTIICSRRAYDDPAKVFASAEVWRGVNIQRISTTAFGKRAKWRRALDFASFIVACVGRLLFVSKPDLVIALTSPPLISFIGAWYARWRGARFVYWVMDLNPDEAIAAGWLREDSLPARSLHALSRYSFRNASKIVALDRFMKQRIESKGIDPKKIVVLPPWSHDDAARFDAPGRQRFRHTHGLADKFVVMYSGNHSPCHPLDTLIGAARTLANDPCVAFLFVGGGSEFARVKQFADSENLKNILCLPYQPLSDLASSLSAADLHVVVMGEKFVGLIHPCKIYNVLGVGSPAMCIGPSPSHLTEIVAALQSAVCATVKHGDVANCVATIQRIRDLGQRGEPEHYAPVSATFAQQKLLPLMVDELERA